MAKERKDTMEQNREQVREVTITVPVSPDEPTGYNAIHIDTKLNAADAITLRRIGDGMRAAGIPVQNPQDVVREMIRRVGAQL